MNLILFDDPVTWLSLHPFTLTRPTALIRTGIRTIAEKWEHHFQTKPSFSTAQYLSKKFPLVSAADNLLINGALCPDDSLLSAIEALRPGEYLLHNDRVLASRQPNVHTEHLMEGTARPYTDNITYIDRPWKIFRHNAEQIRYDFRHITHGRKSQGINDKHTVVYNEGSVFVEEGVTVRAAIINAEHGPVYLGKNSIVQEGAIIRGTFALCEGGHINMGAKMRGDTTVGPYSKVGGEVSLSVIFGHSNKAHDGFLGCSVIGEWCNLGADSNTSNLKNNYDFIKVWNHASETYEDSGLQFCGLMMGDHSKCSINTMFNTGSVVDVSCNVFGDGFPPTYIPSFSWGGSGGLAVFKPEKALEVARRVFERRNLQLDDVEQELLMHVFSMTAKSRTQHSA
jgi:UDP-N-acetylglucosamine diphosphorylase/glucosamine-1-phosphate N-acetyltransferase